MQEVQQDWLSIVEQSVNAPPLPLNVNNACSQKRFVSHFLQHFLLIFRSLFLKYTTCTVMCLFFSVSKVVFLSNSLAKPRKAATAQVVSTEIIYFKCGRGAETEYGNSLRFGFFKSGTGSRQNRRSCWKIYHPSRPFSKYMYQAITLSLLFYVLKFNYRSFTSFAHLQKSPCFFYTTCCI